MTSLKAGDWVEVRSKDEILATLDSNGELDHLPFMPEMFQFCGKRFQVWKRAHKTCDTVNKTGGRRIPNTVHLDQARCDGQAHGGCGAACLVFWKEAWLKPVDDADTRARRDATQKCSERDVWAATKTSTDASDPDPTYSCQATTLPRATTYLPWWDFRQYVEDYTSDNESLGELVGGAVYVGYHELVSRAGRRSRRAAGLLIGLYDRVQSMVGGVPYPRRQGAIPAGTRTPSRPLGLKPGDVVRVKTHLEILQTLDTNNKNRGMYFDAEEVPYCGNKYRVRAAVTKIINEKTGKMLALKGENVILEDVYCKARYSDRRMFCPRAIYPIWRETWLERVDEGNDSNGGNGNGSLAR